MNRLTLWTRKYSLSSALVWAIAILGLAALIYLFILLPSYLELDGLSIPIFWRWFIIGFYLLALLSLFLTPIRLTSHKMPSQRVAEEQEANRQSLISTMAAGTIHEIRSPLTAARGFIQLINSLANNDTRTKEYSEYALLEMDRIEQLLQEYMLLSKAIAPKCEPINLWDAAHNSYQMMKAIMAERHIRLRFEGVRPVCILGDSFYLQQALQHLLLNAAEATPARGQVTIKVESDDSEAILVVSDTGVGMSQEALLHCFDPFYSTKESGTGLGLAICQRMITDMQGRIEVDSQPNLGTTFTITFPLYKSQEAKSGG